MAASITNEMFPLLFERFLSVSLTTDNATKSSTPR